MKYALIKTNETYETGGYYDDDLWIEEETHELFRIKALKDFRGIKTGELGGLVSSEDVLSQEGTSWIDYDSKVINSKIQDDTRIKGSTIYSSKIYGNSTIINSKIQYSTLIKTRIENSYVVYMNITTSGIKDSDVRYSKFENIECKNSIISNHNCNLGNIADVKVSYDSIEPRK